ncbi:RHS repeat-associated core domain-containing protein [Enterobacter hormaechei]|uniref:RHS repeat-associated core domain-containing protein n=1 Tax=Enterobacter hormaechei TaxID=158836 RepID=UPI0029490C03|nr:RHS repeat-associated core domain-containing protein [Enterobacter hormaechei]MDV5373151.1 RHS repeat-associated core domain-containing protein [Enterobacter hormaechei]
MTRQTISADPALLPVDGDGKAYAEQRWSYDALDNLLSEETVYPSVAERSFVRTYHYDEPETDPFRLTRVSPGWSSAGDWVPEWDTCGRLKTDESGRALTYGPDGLLSGVGQTRYAYDALFRAARVEDGDRVLRRWYRGDTLVAESDDAGTTYLHRGALGGMAESRVAGAVRTVLLSGADAQGSVVTENTAAGVRAVRYDVWGRDSGEAGEGRTGYAGMVREEEGYLPGSYRWYSPRLRRFSAPDSASPFGEGGINPYAWAGNNPVMRNDTDGHAWWNWLIAGVTLAVGVVGTVASLGTLAPVFAPVAAAGVSAGLGAAVAAGATVMAGLTVTQAAVMAGAVLGGVSLAAGIASLTLEATGHEKEAGILGWVSLGTGVASLGLSLAPAVARGVTRAGQFVGKWQYSLQHAGGKPGTSAVATTVSTNAAAEYQYTRALGATVIYKPRRMIDTHGFISHFLDTGEPGVLFHGSENGFLSFANGLTETVMTTPQELISKLEGAGINVRQIVQGKRLHFAVCYGTGPKSMAQGLANELGVPVVAYGNNEPIYTPGLSGLLGKRTDRAVAILDKSVPPYGMYVDAQMTVYEPIRRVGRFMITTV